MNRALFIVELELIAAKAKSLAEQMKNGKEWKGDISSGISEINRALERLKIARREDEY